MQKQFVIAVSDVRCNWEESAEPPKYRCYVNDELFAERTWIWKNEYLEEHIQIAALPGKYRVHYELVDTKNASISSTNLRIERGPAIVTRHGDVYIYEAKR